jgi:uncharacterized protein (TIGR02145 family)
MLENIFGVTATTVYTKANIIGGTEKGSDIANYKTAEIGDQTWMAENLDYYVAGSKCYNDDPANCTKYGRLYDWETAKNVCPSGWHLPSDAEWTELTAFAGSSSTAGTKLKATSGWNLSIGGSDDHGFSALPGGRCNSGGTFYGVGDQGYWWSSNEDGGSDLARYMNLRYNYTEVAYGSTL